MFDGALMFPSQINGVGTFIDSVLAGSTDPWCEVGRDNSERGVPFR